MALALLVKLYLSEAKPREPEVVEGAGRRKRVDVYIDLLRLLMPPPQPTLQNAPALKVSQM